jgi:phosphatidylethanolamine/phosphatidyl-N-methylethanolamine N-methyltransferase
MAVRIEDEVRVTAADLVDSMAEARLRVAAVRYKVEGEVRQKAEKFKTHVSRVAGEAKSKLSDEARFIKSWIDDPGRTGSVTPSSPFLARRMASFVDPAIPGPVIEIGPGTGPVTEALVAQGVDPSRLVLVEFDPTFCRLLRARYPRATVVQGDAYSLKRLLAGLMQNPAAGVVSGLPLFTKPLRMRLRLLFDALDLMAPGAPFVQFTYNAVPPLPKRLERVSAEPSERVWMNIPPARVWVYRRD